MNSEIIWQLATILAPTFICPAIGFIWARRGHDYDTMFVNRVAVNLAAPCLVFSIFATADISGEMFREFGLASIAVLMLSAFGAVIFLRLAKLSIRGFFAPLTFNNCGNVGLPLSMFAFGEPGLAFAVVFFAVSSLNNLIFSPWIASGEGSPFVIFRSPIVYSVAAALFFLVFDVTPPLWLANTTELIGGMLIPLMLITLGVSLAQIRLGEFWISFSLAIARLALGFLIGWLVAELFDFEGVAKAVIILQSAMPIAVFNYLFAERYQRNSAEVAGAVLLSTLIGFLLMPVLLWWLLSFAS